MDLREKKREVFRKYKLQNCRSIEIKTRLEIISRLRWQIPGPLFQLILHTRYSGITLRDHVFNITILFRYWTGAKVLYRCFTLLANINIAFLTKYPIKLTCTEISAYPSNSKTTYPNQTIQKISVISSSQSVSLDLSILYYMHRGACK